MGVTIHFRGKLNPKIRVREFYILTSLICKEYGWDITEIKETAQKGNGFKITPHENCEPLFFNLNPEGLFSDRCKTQFAPMDIHKKIVSLFDQVKIKLSELIIQDEGGYWETRKDEHLQKQIENCFIFMQKEKDENPDFYGPIKTDDERIVDLTREIEEEVEVDVEEDE